jgi:hypothetical protein
MRLIINGQDIELTDKQVIARTLQVNDILTLSNRQTNYTNTFSIKRTPKNQRTFDLLGVVGSNSILPYQKNECYLYTDDGECMVYKGWAVIQSTDKDYKINIYDGNIDLYKAIENQNLGDLDLSEINHNKNLTTVVNSFTANLPYKYIVADFNGNMIWNTNRINLDFLVPSAKVSYLWDKIFDTFGFTYEGSIFSTDNFTNLWLTYPKNLPLSSQVTPVTIFEGSTEVTFDEVVARPLIFDQNIIVDTADLIEPHAKGCFPCFIRKGNGDVRKSAAVYFLALGSRGSRDPLVIQGRLKVENSISCRKRRVYVVDRPACSKTDPKSPHRLVMGRSAIIELSYSQSTIGRCARLRKGF